MRSKLGKWLHDSSNPSVHLCFLSKGFYLPTMPGDLLFDQKNWKIVIHSGVRAGKILLQYSSDAPIWMADTENSLEMCPETAWPGDGGKGGTGRCREGWLSLKIPLCFCFVLYWSPFGCSNSRSIYGKLCENHIVRPDPSRWGEGLTWERPGLLPSQWISGHAYIMEDFVIGRQLTD